MTPMAQATRAGLRRGAIELRQSFTNAQDLWGYFFPVIVLVVVLFFMRDSTLPGTGFSRGAQVLPSVLGMSVAFTGLASLASILVIEREDGTLLRAKATPNGMVGYLIGKLTTIAGMTLTSLACQIVPALFFVDGLAVDAGGWATLLWVLALGLVATLPLGAIFGSLLSNARSLGLIMMPLMGVVGISGIFVPITALPGWLQAIGQAFPVYWLGLGMRAALLPDAMAAVELGGVWRQPQTFGMLALWAVAGLAVAPVVLRRMARRESGSSVAARREKALRRVG